MYHKPEEKSREVEKEVFRIHHKDIPRGITQCTQHTLEPLNDNEVICRVCNSVWIVNSDILK